MGHVIIENVIVEFLYLSNALFRKSKMFIIS